VGSGRFRVGGFDRDWFGKREPDTEDPIRHRAAMPNLTFDRHRRRAVAWRNFKRDAHAALDRRGRNDSDAARADVARQDRKRAARLA
jgi:hypothetical protein